MLISQSNKPVILLTMGHTRGIGPEIIIRSLTRPSVRKLASFLIIGEAHALKKAAALLKTAVGINQIDLWELLNSEKIAYKQNALNSVDLGVEDPKKDPLRYINAALALINSEIGNALVTAPVNKEDIIKSGIKFSGHTEYLARLTNTKKVGMMFVSDRLKITLATRHIPLKKVHTLLTKETIRDAALLTNSFLKNRLKIKHPKIGILALNPHAGEGGALGNEEKDIIKPAVLSLKRKIPKITGPLPADSAFNLLYNKKLDSVIAMHHDQGMIPLKMTEKNKSVNVTLGLPFIRTSPVHGTAYDIAGEGCADPCSMIEAIKLAYKLC